MAKEGAKKNASTPPKAGDKPGRRITKQTSDDVSMGPPPSLMEPFERPLKLYRPFTTIPSFTVDKVEPSLPPVLSQRQVPLARWPGWIPFLRKSLDTESINLPQEVPVDEQVLDYIYDWAAWAAEIPDPTRREQVLEFVMRTMERVMKHGIESRAWGPMKVWKNGEKADVKIEIKLTTKGVEETRRTASLASKSADQDVIATPFKESTKIAQGSTSKEADFSEVSAPIPHGTTKEKDLEQQDADHQAIEPENIANLTPPGNTNSSTSSPHRSQTENSAGKKRALDQNFESGDDALAAQAKKQKVIQERPFTPSSPTTVGKLPVEKSRPTLPSSPTSDLELEKRTQYRQRVFLKRLNQVLKRQEVQTCRGRCGKWVTILERLKNANVPIEERNDLRRDFMVGYQKWGQEGQTRVGAGSEKAARSVTDHPAEDFVEKAASATEDGVDAADNEMTDAVEKVPGHHMSLVGPSSHPSA